MHFNNPEKDIDMMKSKLEDPSYRSILKDFAGKAMWYDWIAFALAVPFMILFSIMIIPINFIDRE